ncbi:hypothetical protein B0H15DRAFT_958767 [Mycena belliarum]|uniref:Uncharacterized protein n=1 Tax=Mycena belliarum TaxID=1033014 RepID=A0AAD6XK95_9AGAR|nr:hypothetical protein B0H15DRAFT_958767 [Mycena belliae]
MQSLALDESDCPQRGRRLPRLVSQGSDFRQRKKHIRRSASHPPQHGAHPYSAGGVRAPPPPNDPDARCRSGVNAMAKRRGADEAGRMGLPAASDALRLPARAPIPRSREGHEALKAAAPASRDVPGLGAGGPDEGRNTDRLDTPVRLPFEEGSPRALQITQRCSERGTCRVGRRSGGAAEVLIVRR